MESTRTMTPTTPVLGWNWNATAVTTPEKAHYNSHHHALGPLPSPTMSPTMSFATLRCWQKLMAFKKKHRELPAAAVNGPGPRPRYSVAAGAQEALGKLSASARSELPEAILAFQGAVQVTSATAKGDEVYFPTPLREQEATAAIKGLEACAAAAISKLRYGTDSRTIQIDSDKVSAFLMSAYLTTLDGMDKPDPRIKNRIPDTDLNQAQSVLYRRMSANLYRTKNPDEYYHIHGSLDADVTLQMLGLPKENPAMTDYHAIIDYIESAVQKFTAAELDALNISHRQAGIQALTWPQFQATPHGKAMLKLPPLTVRPNPADARITPPTPFPSPTPPSSASPQYALAGIKVLELCRVIAGPTIGRCLAAHGAQVIKVTSPDLPDVPFFQLDVNTGKHAIHLDLRPDNNGRTATHDREIFASLLADADVLIDGYRPGSLARLGYGPEALAQIAQQRGKGFVYVAEDCFGGSDLPASAGAEWASRAGWQQIADCVTGVAWAQGEFMGLDEPVVPPFPMSDYGTGALGCAAALTGLYRRATEGGSWVCRTSLVQYDAFLLGLGLLPETERTRLRREHGHEDKNPAGFFGLRHSDSVDEVGRRALASMRRTVPHLFSNRDGDESGLMQAAWSPAFQGVVRWPREAITIEGVRVGHVRTARPNGWDDKTLGWEGWEEEMLGQEQEQEESDSDDNNYSWVGGEK
ncbi:CoA-transferase family III domain-containing protein [Chaetomium sp. MPI-SDFR-AT-0129]|nr:CoA-transferase family III domain-containing protein [Chaetomium sp. MPI-SDFR-AT-0129]